MAARCTARRVGGFLLPVALFLATGTLAGCSSSLDEGDGNTTTDLAKVSVTGKPGAKPTIDVHAPFATTKTDRRVLETGTGSVVQPGLRVTVDYLAVNGTDGRQFATSFGLASSTFTLDTQQTIKGMIEGLSGVTVGSRVLVAVPPADGYGTNGNATLGIGPTDSMVFVVDVHAAQKVLLRATGKPVKPGPGLPKVTLNQKTGAPAVTIPKSIPPAKMVVQTLIQGSGSKVTKGTMIAHYTGVVWGSGKVFDSSWPKASPSRFVMGEGQVLAGWDDGLAGKRVGSQVLLVLPPDKAYGLMGKPEKGIKGTDTVVFVVDILDATAADSTPPTPS